MKTTRSDSVFEAYIHRVRSLAKTGGIRKPTAATIQSQIDRTMNFLLELDKLRLELVEQEKVIHISSRALAQAVKRSRPNIYQVPEIPKNFHHTRMIG